MLVKQCLLGTVPIILGDSCLGLLRCWFIKGCGDFCAILSKKFKSGGTESRKIWVKIGRIGKVFLRDGSLGKMGCCVFFCFLRFFSVFERKVIEIFRKWSVFLSTKLSTLVIAQSGRGEFFDTDLHRKTLMKRDFWPPQHQLRKCWASESHEWTRKRLRILPQRKMRTERKLTTKCSNGTKNWRDGCGFKRIDW